MKHNLVDKIGFVAGHTPVEPIVKWLGWGARHFRIGAEWAQFEPRQGDYQFNVLKEAFSLIKAAGGKILVHLFAVPKWVGPDYYPKIDHITYDAIPIFRAEWAPLWMQYVMAFLTWLQLNDFQDVVEVCGPIVETNIPAWWEKERTQLQIESGESRQEGTAEEFLATVIRPAAPLIRGTGKKVIAGTVTLQGERTYSFNRAIKQFEIYKYRNFGSIDHLDFHVYREVGDWTVQDIKRVFKHFDLEAEAAKERMDIDWEKRKLRNVWVTEMGFNEKNGFTAAENLGRWFQNLFGQAEEYTGEMRQERKYKQFLASSESTDPEDIAMWAKVKRFYLYRASEYGQEAGTDGLLRKDFTPKRAANLIIEYLQAGA